MENVKTENNMYIFKNLRQEINELRSNGVEFKLERTDFGFKITTLSECPFLWKTYNEEAQFVWAFGSKK